MLELALALQLQLVSQCSPNVAPATMAALVHVESSNNPYAIGVVGGALKRQPTSKAEAIAAAQDLERQGKNFSMGLAQINRHNLPRYGLKYEDAFDACTNLRVGGEILGECYARALPKHGEKQAALRAALSCYYSGNFVRGFRPDKPGDPSYVEKVVAAAGQGGQPVMVPAIQAGPVAPASRRVESSVLVPSDSEAKRIEAMVDMTAAEAPIAEDGIEDGPDFAGLADAQPARLRVVNDSDAAPAQPAPARLESTSVVF